AFKAVEPPPAPRASKADFDRSVEQKGKIGFQPLLQPVFEKSYNPGIDAAATALVGITGVGEPIRHDPDSFSQSGLDDLFDMLRAGGEHQQELGLGHHTLRLDDQPAYGFADRRAARFSGNQKPD